MRRAVRYVFAVVGIAAIAATGSVATSSAAVANGDRRRQHRAGGGRDGRCGATGDGDVRRAGHQPPRRRAEPSRSRRQPPQRVFHLAQQPCPAMEPGRLLARAFADNGVGRRRADELRDGRRGGECRRHLRAHLHRQHRRAGGARDAGVDGQVQVPDADRHVHALREAARRHDRFAHDRHPSRAIRRATRLTVEYAVRVTWGGVYVHSAPWSVGSQGYANVSHGCINLSPDNAAWYFDTVSIGDPIIVQCVDALTRTLGVQVLRGR